MTEPDSYERLERWLHWKIGRPLTNDEKQQLRNLIRRYIGELLDAAKTLIGTPRAD